MRLLTCCLLAMATSSHAAIINHSTEWTATIGGVAHNHTAGWQYLENDGGEFWGGSQVGPLSGNNLQSITARSTRMMSYDGTPASYVGEVTFELDSGATAYLTSEFGDFAWTDLPNPATTDATLWLDGNLWAPPLDGAIHFGPTIVLEPGVHTFAWNYSSTDDDARNVMFAVRLNHVPEPGGLASIGLVALAALARLHRLGQVPASVGR